jgi:hypothetical protein
VSKRSSAPRALLAGVALALLHAGSNVYADAVDPRVPRRIVRARAPARVELPARPALAWQARVVEPLLGAPVADGEASLLVGHASGLLVELDGNGRTLRTVRAGSSLAFGPVLLASRRRLVVTGDAEAVVVLPSGRVESRQKLGFRELDAGALATPTSDGGVLLAAGARFARFGPTGALTARGSAREVLRALDEWRGLALLVERSGRVLGLPHAGDPFELANLNRSVRTAETRGDRLLALVGDRELVELELGTGAVRTIWADPPLVPRELFLLPNDDVRMVVSSSLLVGLDRTGHESFRISQPGTASEATVTALGDARGAMLVATSGLDLRLVGETGDVLEIPGTACPDPLRPVALGKGLSVASCRSGLLFGISGKGR